MKIKLLWFSIGYFLFYLLVNFSFALPNEFDGNSIAVLMRNSSYGYWWRLMDIALWFLFSLIPFFILARFYPEKKLYFFLLLVPGIPAACLIRFYCARLIANYPIPLNVYLFKNSYFLVCYNLYAIVFFFIRYSQHKVLQAKELMIESRQSELSFLRSQINPHFLFNSLNNIYSLVYDKSDHALSAIAGLSDILRYTLYDVSEAVPITKEIDYIKKYIALQILRHEGPLKIQLEVSELSPHVNFPPLLFLPFVENAFKHGELSNENGILEICIQTTGKKILFHCRNKKNESQKDTGSGIGLQNVKRRLELLYPGKHALNIKEDNEYFDVNLTIAHES